MQKRMTKNSQKEKPSWDWTQVECTLKINESNKKNMLWNLAPTIILTNPTSQFSDPNVRLYIDTQKSLQYSPELGWNWHKSWNLPNISLRLEIKDQNSGEQLLAPKSLYAQMFAVKRNSDDKNDRLVLTDVGIRGDGKMEMIDGQVYFSAMKFSSTTYNNQGMNFNLLIVLYINQEQSEKPKILTAVMSPGIFVDSRRSARDYQQKKFNSFIEPFAYQNLEKQYIKRQNKSKTQCEILIKNDPQGFYNYLTAPNIRHKVKHPVFLAIKFSSCVQIYYNTQLLQNLDEKQLIETLQKKLLKQSKSKQKLQNPFVGNASDKTFIFLAQNLQDSLKKKKVMESIQTMQNSSIGILYEKKQLPSTFLPIGESEALVRAYRECYESLLQLCKKFQPSDSEGSDEEDRQNDEVSSQSVKKVKREQNGYRKISVKTNPNQNNASTSKNKVQPAKQYLKQQDDGLDALEEPKFFPPTLNDIGFKKGSAFNRPSGFKSIGEEQNKQKGNNQNLFIHSQMNSNRQSILDSMQQSQLNGMSNPLIGMNNPLIGMNNTLSALSNPMSGMNQLYGQMGGQNRNSQSLFGNNLMLSNWLNTVKNNNVGLYDSMVGNNHPNSEKQRFNNKNQQEKLQHQQRQMQDQQIRKLMHQINLYQQLLAQLTYQNQLLGRNIGLNNNISASQNQAQSAQISNQLGSNPINPMNCSPQVLSNMLSSMQGGIPMGINGMGNIPGLSNLSSLNNQLGLNSNLGLTNPLGLNSLLGLNGNSLNNLVGLSGMMPNMGNLNSFQNPLLNNNLQNLHNLQGMEGIQTPSHIRMNDLLRSQMQRNNKPPEKRQKQDQK